MHEPLDERERPFSERELRPPRRAEQVRDQRERRAVDAREEECRPAGRDDAAMDLRGLLVGIDGSVHDGQVAIAAELIDERSEIGERHEAVDR